MDNLIGITVPPYIEERLAAIAARFQCEILHPNITLIPAELLKGVKALNGKLQAFCLSQPPADVVLGGPYIGADYKLHLAVLSGIGLNKIRGNLIERLKLPDMPEEYHTYVTLMKSRGESGRISEDILSETRAVFSKPLSLSAEAIEVYSRASEEEPYKMSAVYPLTGR